MKSELKAAHEGKEAASREKEQAFRDNETGLKKARERGDQWQRSGEQSAEIIESMREERRTGMKQLADAEVEITRLEGVIRRNETERGRRREEWEQNVAQLKQEWRDERSKWERESSNVMAG